MNTKTILTKEEAEVIIHFMALAAEAAAEDERFGEIWRLERFRREGPKQLAEQFNVAGV